MTIDWIKAPAGTTGAMVADFNGATVKRGDIEWIPSSITPKGQYQVGAGAWVYHEAPQHWNGEGLPPVGTVCEAKMPPRGVQMAIKEWTWRKVEVVRLNNGVRASEREVLVFDLENTAPSWVDELRPIRTAEQIAEDERLEAINKILEDSMGRCDLIGASYLYDAQYRKQVSQ